MAKNGRLPATALKRLSWNSWRLTKAAAASAERLNKAYKASTGHNLTINYGYRTYAEQVRLWIANGYNPGKAARPGTSNHGLGVAMDVSTGGAGFGSITFKWINEHKSYGWRRSSYAYTRAHEPWHWEYHADKDLRRAGKGKTLTVTWGYSKPYKPGTSKKVRAKARKYTRKPGFTIKWSRREYRYGVWWCVTSHGTWYRASNISNQP